MRDEPPPQISKYVSPDGALTLMVIREEDDITVGFEGYYWHTHGDILATIGLPEEKAVEDFVDTVLNGRAAIEVMILNGVAVDISVVELPLRGDPPYREKGQTFVFRLWDGSILAAYGPETLP